MEKETVKIHIADIICNAVWKNIPRTYVNSTGLFIGKVKIAEYYFDGTRPRNDPKQYRVSSSLPTIKQNLGNYETTEECEAVCINVAKTFCKQLEGI
jgi:hypothetical protein